MRMNRREMVAGLGLAGLAGRVAGETPGTVLASGVYPWEAMRVARSSKDGESRSTLRGTTLSGEAVAVHETVLPVGATPPALHAIGHTEVVTVVEGEATFEHDGKEEKVGPGGVMYVAKGTVHRMKNLGQTPVRFVVVAVGGDVG